MKKRGKLEMTLKLLKYDIRSAFRTMWMFWVAAPIIALLVAFVKWGYTRVDLFNDVLSFAGGVVKGATNAAFIICMIVMIVLTIVIIISRYYKGLVGQEGYLMHTLPAKPWQLITSKGITAFITSVISGVVAIIAFICLGGFQSLKGGFEVIGDLLKAFGSDPRYIIIAIEIMLVVIFGVLKVIYQLYASMSIGQLFDKHRPLCSVLSFVLLSIVLSIIGVTLLAGFGDMISDTIETWYVNLDEFKTINLVIWSAFAVEFVQVALFHVISERILSKKLNLL